ncbi:hypothetical protein ACGG0V_004747 [Salmonella enterica]|nr:hypothetical protein [Salmonella enterica subsp. enterica serovar Sandiego]EEK2576826.1 hypothetical protein [Salmonella enterica subsp. enterica serovar Montevideo]
MRTLGFISLLFIAYFAKADIKQQLQQRSDATSRAVVANVERKQRLLSEKLKLQMKINLLRGEIGSAQGEEKKTLQDQLKNLEKQKDSL